MASRKTLVAIAGPTAVGKTAIAIQIAQHFNTSILSFDSRQCYAEMKIGVARPTDEELRQVPHYFIATHSVHEPVDAAAYEQYALNTLQLLFEHHDVVVAVGGTGLYLKALCEGMDPMPYIPEEIRKSLRQSYEQNGLDWIQTKLSAMDPLFAATGEMGNPHRMLRALEIVTVSGKSIRAFQQQRTAERSFKTIKIGLELPRETLVTRLNHRVETMMKQGLENETISLKDFKHLQALQTVGYQELFDYFDGITTLHAAIEKIKTHTRQYAKRQMTWFKKDKELQWFAPSHITEIKANLEAVLSK